jgi:hypothetical protein
MRFVIFLSFAAAAAAQTVTTSGIISGVAGSGPQTMVINGRWATTSGAFASVGGGGAIAGQPYSAEQVTEHVQTLADGTHITRPADKVMFYRDSEGRTRIERTFPIPAGVPEGAVVRPSLIEINDSVSGAHYTLDEQRHIAHRFSFPTALPAPPPASNTASTRGTTLLALSPSPGAVPNPAFAQAAPAIDAQRDKSQTSHESLGTQTIEGILAEGRRTTTVYPVGAIGNDRPVTVVRESWMSPELKVVVLSKDSDPRNGESTTRLVNISRAEPDATLFQVPPDYEIVDPQPAPGR